MSDKITVTYTTIPRQPRAVVMITLAKPRIHYVGAILDFITHPLVWYPMWMAAAVFAWRLFA